jgi:subtilisin family serine protease
VAGVAALIESRYPDLAPDLVAAALTSTTSDRPTGGYDSQVGFGVVNANAALVKAGKLAHDQPPETSVPATVRFHGTIVPQPVRPRGTAQLVLFALLALASLVLIGAAATRVTLLRRASRSPGHAGDF